MHHSATETDSQDLWGKVLTDLREKLSGHSYDTWIEPLSGQVKNENTLVLYAPSDFAKEWIDARYTSLLLQTLRKITGQDFKIKVTLAEKQNSSSQLKMNEEQAMGYMMLACKEVGLTQDWIEQLCTSLQSQFDNYTIEEAEKEGMKRNHSFTSESC